MLCCIISISTCHMYRSLRHPLGNSGGMHSHEPFERSPLSIDSSAQASRTVRLCRNCTISCKPSVEGRLVDGLLDGVSLLICV